MIKKAITSAMLISMVAIITSACAPIVNVRGYIPETYRLEQIKPGQDDKQAVFEILGSPSTKATFDDSTWYYISARNERRGFMNENITYRNILAVRFDGNNMVTGVDNYGLEDGKVVNYVNRETPTRGKELTFVEQMFGNIGRLPGVASNGGNN